MSNSSRFSNPFPQFHDASGIARNGATLSFYLTGSTTPSPAYTDAAHTTPAGTDGVVTLNSLGSSPTDLFLDPAISYKVVLKDSNGVVIWTADPYYDPLLNQQAKFAVYAGDPNGNVAGTAGTPGGTPADAIFDTSNLIIWVCTTTGNAATAVWTSTTGQLAGAITFTGVISPSAIVANQDNYNPTGLASASTLRLAVNTDADLTGIAGGTSGRLLTLVNIGTNRLTLRDASGSSTAVNRFAMGDDVFLDPSYTMTLIYDSVTARWRPFSLPFRMAFGASGYLSNLSIAASVNANILTVSIKNSRGNDPTPGEPVKVAFRDPTATTGTYALRSITAALSMVLTAGSRVGFNANETNDIAVGLIDNSGTVELALCANGAAFTEDRSVSTVAEGGAGAADSKNTIYSTTARAGVACRIVGMIRITTGATAGNWSNAPTRLTVLPPSVAIPYRNTIKVMATVGASGTTMQDSYNVSSNTDNGTGDQTITYAVAMALVNYPVSVMTTHATDLITNVFNTGGAVVGSIRAIGHTDAGAAADPNNDPDNNGWFFMCAGAL